MATSFMAPRKKVWARNVEEKKEGELWKRTSGGEGTGDVTLVSRTRRGVV